MSSLKKGVLFVASLSAISLGTVAVVASLPSAAGAAGGKAIVTLGKVGELLARGAAVGVPVHVTCSLPTVPAGQSLSQNVSVQLNEVVAGNVIQEGYGNESEFPCDGGPHSITVFVAASGAGPLGGSPAHPFSGGTAFASAQMSICTMPGIFPPPPPFAPFAGPTSPASPTAAGVPGCQFARNTTVFTIQGAG